MMDRAMAAIEMTGTVDEHHQLRLDGTLPLAGPQHVRVIVLYSLNDDLDENVWLRAAARSPAFAYLGEPEEDIYSLSDGKPFCDEA